MLRLIIALILLALCLKSDAQVPEEKLECDFSSLKKDGQGCFPLGAISASNGCKLPAGTCFAIPMALVDEFNHPVDTDSARMQKCSHKDTPEYAEKYSKAPAPEPFSKEPLDERKKIIAILDTSALALLKNSMLQNISIVFFDKGGRFSAGFQKEAERYLLDKGVRKGQFNIKIVNKVER